MKNSESNKTKILFFAPLVSLKLNMSGGAGTHMRAMIKELENNNFEVIKAIGGDLFEKGENKKLSISKDQKLEKKLSGKIKKLVPSSIKYFYHDYSIKRFDNLVFDRVESILQKDNDIRVIYERSAYGYASGIKLAKKFGLKHIFESDVLMLDLIKSHTSLFFNKWIYRKLERGKFQFTDAVVVMSEFSVKLCSEYWSIPSEKIFNKELGIYQNSIKNQEVVDVKVKYGIEDKIVVGFVGYFMPYQNISLLLDCALKLRRNESLVFMFVGTGSQLNIFKEFVKTHNLKNVIFTGLIDKSIVSNYYRAIDLAIITDCAYHMYPVKFLEYSLFNLPTLTPRYNVFREFYETQSKFDEMTFEPGESLSLANKIQYSIENLERINNEVKHTRIYVERYKTWEQSGIKLKNIIEKTLNI